jgi:hypothetical protein
MSASLDGIVGRDAIESIADVQQAITSGGSITTTTVTASTLNTNLMTIANDQINAIGSSTNIIVNTSASGAFKVDNLQVKTNTLSSSNTDGDIVLDPNGSGKVLLGTLPIKADQTVSASEDDYVLTYDNASNVISLEPSAGGGVPSQLSNSDMNIINSAITVSNSLANLTITNGTTGSTIIDGTLTFKNNEISTQQTNGFINITPDGTGKVILDQQLYVDRDGITQNSNSDIYMTTTGKVRITNMSLQDKTLKAEVGDLNLTCDDTTNKVFIGSLPFKLDQTVGASEDNYVLTYDHSTAKIQLEALSSASNWTTTGLDIYRTSKVGIGANSSTINSQLMVKDTGASHTAVQVTSGAGQNCSLKLSRGAGDWSISNSETIGLHMDTNRLLISKLTAEGNNLTGYAGSTMDIDCQNSRVGIACYPYGGSIANTLQLGSIASGRTESLKISTNAGAGVADKSVELGADATSNFIESNDSANAPIELQVRQGTNGNVMVVDTDGDVGINTSAPDAKLHITASSGKRQLELEGDPVSSSQVLITGGTYGIAMTMNNASASNYALSINNSVSNILYFQNNGVLGLGTTSPQAKIHINGDSNSTAVMSSGARRYFKGISTSTTSDTSTWAFSDASLYATGDIIGSSWIVSLQSTTFSDRRMKENIVDVQDDQCLQKLRLLKPKQYTYKDTHKRGNAPVWGFIAQDVKSTLDYAVSTMQKEIPNIYKLASVSNDGKTLTFTENIVLQDGHQRLMLKTWKDTEVRAVIASHTANTITLEEPLEQHDITCEEVTNEIFVYGQIVSDFNHLDKDAIFTVAVSALQEVDRQQQLHKNKISTLEARMSILEQRLNNAGL